MDDSLLSNTRRYHDMTPAIASRMLNCAKAAEASGADGILVTCTSVHQATKLIRPLLSIPILNIEEPVEEQAVATGKRIGVLATLPTSPAAISRVILEKAQDQDKAVELATLRREGSILQGHPDMKRCPGIDISTGSLGQGLSAAVGMALCGKGDEKYYRAFCLVGDGESNEGQIWEALETAFKYRLDNLVILLDQNGLQNDGACRDVMPGGDLSAKFRAFGCEV